jgi:hypothetical protein
MVEWKKFEPGDRGCVAGRQSEFDFIVGSRGREEDLMDFACGSLSLVTSAATKP